MKASIDGLVYDTDRAEKICDLGSPSGVYPSDFRYWEAGLYVTKKGRFFLAGEGGALSRFGESLGGNSRGGGSGIRVLDAEEALTLAEGELSPAKLSKFFTLQEA